MRRSFADPYFYPGTAVLRNKPGLRDKEALRLFEYEQSKLRGEALRERPLSGKFDLDHLNAIHAYLFQDVYPWAGEIRTVNISKGNSSFAFHEYIESEAKRLSQSLAKENRLQGMEKPRFVERLAHYHAEWNALHPFREGNGRALREFVSQIARAAGFELDQTRIDNSKGRWNKAAELSFHGELDLLKQMFSNAVRPLRSVVFEKLPEREALARHPELKGAFDKLRSMSDSAEGRVAGGDTARNRELEHTRAEIIRTLDAGEMPAPQAARQPKPPRARQPKTAYQTKRARPKRRQTRS